MSRELEDVSVVNKHRLAIAAVLDTIRKSTPAPAPGPVLRVSDSGAITTNKGAIIREASAPPPTKEK